MSQSATCTICGSQYTPINDQLPLGIDGESYWICPAEYPPTAGGVDAYFAAYVRIVTKIREMRNEKASKTGN